MSQIYNYISQEVEDILPPYFEVAPQPLSEKDENINKIFNYIDRVEATEGQQDLQQQYQQFPNQEEFNYSQQPHIEDGYYRQPQFNYPASKQRQYEEDHEQAQYAQQFIHEHQYEDYVSVEQFQSNTAEMNNFQQSMEQQQQLSEQKNYSTGNSLTYNTYNTFDESRNDCQRAPSMNYLTPQLTDQDIYAAQNHTTFSAVCDSYGSYNSTASNSQKTTPNNTYEMTPNESSSEFDQEMKYDEKIVQKATKKVKQVIQKTKPKQSPPQRNSLIQQKPQPAIVQHSPSKGSSCSSVKTKNHLRNFISKLKQIVRGIQDENHWAIKRIQNKFKSELEELNMDITTFIKLFKDFSEGIDMKGYFNGNRFIELYQIPVDLVDLELKLLKSWFREFTFEFYSQNVLIYLFHDNIRVNKETVKAQLDLIPSYLMNILEPTSLNENFKKHRNFNVFQKSMNQHILANSQNL